MRHPLNQLIYNRIRSVEPLKGPVLPLPAMGQKRCRHIWVSLLVMGRETRIGSVLGYRYTWCTGNSVYVFTRSRPAYQDNKHSPDELLYPCSTASSDIGTHALDCIRLSKCTGCWLHSIQLMLSECTLIFCLERWRLCRPGYNHKINIPSWSAMLEAFVHFYHPWLTNEFTGS